MERSAAIVLRSPSARPVGSVLFDLPSAAERAGVPVRTLAKYCVHGLVQPADPHERGEFFLSEEAIFRVRRAERLRIRYDLSLRACAMILRLEAENERLREELRFWRG